MLEKMKWDCSCGCKENVGEFCEKCGQKGIVLWNCSCGQEGNRGAFCPNCGKAKEQKELGAYTEKVQEQKEEGMPPAEKKNRWKTASIVSVAICIGIAAVFAILYYADGKKPSQNTADIKGMQAGNEKAEQKKNPQTRDGAYGHDL